MSWVYIFEDGTKLELIHCGLSLAEIWKLEELHGKLKDSKRKDLRWQ